jgi:hypothetical protein
MSHNFLTIALSNEVVVTALKLSLLVGTVLALINHGAEILQGTLTKGNIYQIALTYLVPYSVSTYSSVKAIQKRINTNI